MWNRIGESILEFICAGAVGVAFYFAAEAGTPEQFGAAAFLSAMVLTSYVRLEGSNGPQT